MVKVFISSTTIDLGSYREEVKRVLSTMGDYQPIEEDSFEMDYREVTTILNTTIVECDAVICLVGFAFGHEPRNADFIDRRRSYSQLEYEIAKKRHKPTYVFIATEQCPLDHPLKEDPELANLQRKFRDWLKAGRDIYYEFSSKEDLAKKIAKLKIRPIETISDPTPARSGILSWSLVLLLVLSGAGLYYRCLDSELNPPPPPQPEMNQTFISSLANPPPEGQDQMTSAISAAPEPRSAGQLKLSLSVGYSCKYGKVVLRRKKDGRGHTNLVDLSNRNPNGTAHMGFVQFPSLAEGEYGWSIRLDDGQTLVTNTVRIEANHAQAISVSINPVTVRIEVVPPEAEIEIVKGLLEEGQFHPKDGMGKAFLRPGLSTLRFRLKDYRIIETNIFIPVSDRSQERSIKVTMIPQRYPLGIKPLSILDSGGFMMSRTEITRAQFAAYVMESLGSNRWEAPLRMKCLTGQGWEEIVCSWEEPPFKQTEDDPMVGVSWEEANGFCQWLTRTEREAGHLSPHQSYHLPTSDQYQKACRDYQWKENSGNFAGREIERTPWPWPIDVSTIERHQDEWPRTAPVGKAKDIHPITQIEDLAGNIAEWCADDYRKELNARETRNLDPEYFDEDGGGYKAVFGGSWADHDSVDLDLQTRHKAHPTERSDRIGFRVVLEETPISH